MRQLRNLSRLGAVLLPGVLALTPTVAIAQAQPSVPPPATATQAAPPAGGMADQHMMMNDDKMKPAMGMMGCNGKPCGPPQGAAGAMGGMPQPQGMTSPGSSDSTAQPAAPTTQAPMKDHM
jgi:hypothetical protein